MISLRQGAVPSVFSWKRSSPHKRPPPISSMATSVSRKINKTIAEVVEASCPSKIEEESSNLHGHRASAESHLAPEMEEFPSAVNDLQSEENKKITGLEKLLAKTIETKEKLELEVLSLKQNIDLPEEKCEKLEKHVFSFENIKTEDLLLTFYTGFLNDQTMMALYE